MGLAYPYQRVRDPLTLPSGSLRHEIHIQWQGAAAIDQFGSPSSTWQDRYVCLAAMNTISAREQFLAGQVSSQVMHEFRFPWPGELGITAGWRVRFGPGLASTGLIQAQENVLLRNRVQYLLVVEIDGNT